MPEAKVSVVLRAKNRDGKTAVLIAHSATGWIPLEKEDMPLDPQDFIMTEILALDTTSLPRDQLVRFSPALELGAHSDQRITNMRGVGWNLHKVSR